MNGKLKEPQMQTYFQTTNPFNIQLNLNLHSILLQCTNFPVFTFDLCSLTFMQSQ